MSDVVSYTVKDGVAIIQITRADKLNALDEEVIQGLRSALCNMTHLKNDVPFCVLRVTGLSPWAPI